jgi:hypothetical protein
MNRNQKIELLKDLVREIDYDLFKEIFLEMPYSKADETITALIDIIEEHITK